MHYNKVKAVDTGRHFVGQQSPCIDVKISHVAVQYVAHFSLVIYFLWDVVGAQKASAGACLSVSFPLTSRLLRSAFSRPHRNVSLHRLTRTTTQATTTRVTTKEASYVTSSAGPK